MPVTRDPRYIDICAKVSQVNVKVGKAKNFSKRRLDYWKEFDEKNVLFEPLAEMQDIVAAETAILRALKQYRMIGPKGGKLEWLEGISYEKAKSIVFATLNEKGYDHTPCDPLAN